MLNISKITINVNSNPYWHMLEYRINKDTFICYAICINTATCINGIRKIGDDILEVYTGENYNVGSTKKSYSREYSPLKMPKVYQKIFNELQSYYKEYHHIFELMC